MTCQVYNSENQNRPLTDSNPATRDQSRPAPELDIRDSVDHGGTASAEKLLFLDNWRSTLNAISPLRPLEAGRSLRSFSRRRRWASACAVLGLGASLCSSGGMRTMLSIIRVAISDVFSSDVFTICFPSSPIDIVATS